MKKINEYGKAIQASQPLYDFAKKAVLNLMCKIKKPKLWLRANKKERTSWYMGSLQSKTEGSPAPEVTKATSFERSVTRRPTVSSRYANHSIKVSFKSRTTYK